MNAPQRLGFRGAGIGQRHQRGGGAQCGIAAALRDDAASVEQVLGEVSEDFDHRHAGVGLVEVDPPWQRVASSRSHRCDNLLQRFRVSRCRYALDGVHAAVELFDVYARVFGLRHGYLLWSKLYRLGLKSTAPCRRPRLHAHRLEEGVAEYAVWLSRSIEITDPGVEPLGLRESLRYHGFANALDHRGERLPGEAFDELGSACIDVNHSG